MAGPQTKKTQLLALIRRCQQLANEHPDTMAAHHLLELAAQHVQESSELCPRPLVSSLH